MVSQPIFEYIAQQRRQGVGDDAIRDSLRSAGWAEADINEAMGVPPSPNTGTFYQAPAGGNDTTLAVVAYILFFIPLLVQRRSSFVTYHTNQGTVLFIAAFGAQVVLALIPIIGWILLPFAGLGSLVLLIMGIVHVINGEMKSLPLIGGFTIIKDSAGPSPSQPQGTVSGGVPVTPSTGPTMPAAASTGGQPPLTDAPQVGYQQQPSSKKMPIWAKVLIIIFVILAALGIIISLIVRSFWHATVGQYVDRVTTPEFQETLDEFSNGIENFTTFLDGYEQGPLPKPDREPASDFYCTVAGERIPLLGVRDGEEVIFNAGVATVIEKDGKSYISNDYCEFAKTIDPDHPLCECKWVEDDIDSEKVTEDIEQMLWPLYYRWKELGKTREGKKVECKEQAPARSVFEIKGKVCTQEELDRLLDE